MFNTPGEQVSSSTSAAENPVDHELPACQKTPKLLNGIDIHLGYTIRACVVPNLVCENTQNHLAATANPPKCPSHAPVRRQEFVNSQCSRLTAGLVTFRLMIPPTTQTEQFFLPFDYRKITVAPVSGPAGERSVRPSSAGPGRTLFGPTR